MKLQKRVVILLLCFCICFCMISCTGKSNEETVMTYKGVSAPKSLYSYWLSTYKSNFLYYYNDGIDSDEFWDQKIIDQSDESEDQNISDQSDESEDQKISDKSYEQYVSEWVEREMKYRTISLYLFDQYKLKLDDEKIQAIDDDIAEKIDYNGSRSELNSRLAKLGMNIDMLRDVYIANAKYDAVYDYLYGDNGIEKPSEEEKAKYFAENYYCVKYITIYSGANLKTDAEGNYVYDEDGKIELENLSDEEKAIKAQLIDTVMNGLESGGSFEEYISEFSEVDYTGYENGFFVSKNDYSRFGSDIVDAAVKLKVGELKKVSDENVTYIIKKYDLPDYSSLSESDKKQLETMNDNLTRSKFTEKFDVLAADVECNREVIDSLSIREASKNSYF